MSELQIAALIASWVAFGLSLTVFEGSQTLAYVAGVCISYALWGGHP